MPIYAGRRKGTWRVTVYAGGRQYEAIVEGSKAEARKHEARLRLEYAAGKTRVRHVVPTFSDFSTHQYRPHAELHLGARTWRVRKHIVSALSAHFGPIRLDRLREEDVDGYKVWRSAKASPETINAELKVFRTMLRWARTDRGHPVPQELRVRLLPRPARGRVAVWSPEEVRRLYSAAQRVGPKLLPLLVLMLNTGIRKGEAIAAEWSWVDRTARMLRIPVTEHWHPKDKEAREVPLSPAAMQALERLPTREGALFLARGRVPFEAFPDKPFARVLRAAGLAGSPHRTRHTFASLFLARCPDLPLLAQLLGHSTTKVTELYAHMLPGHLDRARGVVDLGPVAAPRKRRTA